MLTQVEWMSEQAHSAPTPKHKSYKYEALAFDCPFGGFFERGPDGQLHYSVSSIPGA
jgi:hypothetical protein